MGNSQAYLQLRLSVSAYLQKISSMSFVHEDLVPKKTSSTGGIRKIVISGHDNGAGTSGHNGMQQQSSEEERAFQSPSDAKHERLRLQERISALDGRPFRLRVDVDSERPSDRDSEEAVAIMRTPSRLTKLSASAPSAKKLRPVSPALKAAREEAKWLQKDKNGLMSCISAKSITPSRGQLIGRPYIESRYFSGEADAAKNIPVYYMSGTTENNSETAHLPAGKRPEEHESTNSYYSNPESRPGKHGERSRILFSKWSNFMGFLYNANICMGLASHCFSTFHQIKT
jgi:hypothetical protein